MSIVVAHLLYLLYCSPVRIFLYILSISYQLNGLQSGMLLGVMCCFVSISLLLVVGVVGISVCYIC